MWNLLDILSILSDDGQCDPALLFWLAEELLDSQTIAGCRKIFDFLESRRERITSNHFKQKQLIILRTCNELLRRLSRAEDTAFCGRVFIFMFQSFPLGDKSSVNLRGEYHVENVTTYEASPVDADSKMDVDAPPSGPREQIESRLSSKATDPKKSDKPLDPDALYPLFWSLQENFSQPKRLFETPHLAAFKESLGATMKVFQTIHNDRGSRKSAEDSKRSLKRKREGGEDDDTNNAFNPKYLTSRDLFELEVRIDPWWYVFKSTNIGHRLAICLSGGTFWFKPSSSSTSFSRCLLSRERSSPQLLPQTRQLCTLTKSSAKMM